jgi:hypothetical protein
MVGEQVSESVDGYMYVCVVDVCVDGLTDRYKWYCE